MLAQQRLSVSDIRMLRSQAENLRDYPNGNVQLLAQSLSDALDEIERQRMRMLEFGVEI